MPYIKPNQLLGIFRLLTSRMEPEIHVQLQGSIKMGSSTSSYLCPP